MSLFGIFRVSCKSSNQCVGTAAANVFDNRVERYVITEIAAPDMM